MDAHIQNGSAESSSNSSVLSTVRTIGEKELDSVEDLIKAGEEVSRLQNFKKKLLENSISSPVKCATDSFLQNPEPSSNPKQETKLTNGVISSNSTLYSCSSITENIDGYFQNDISINIDKSSIEDDVAANGDMSTQETVDIYNVPPSVINKQKNIRSVSRSQESISRCKNNKDESNLSIRDTNFLAYTKSREAHSTFIPHEAESDNVLWNKSSNSQCTLNDTISVCSNSTKSTAYDVSNFQEECGHLYSLALALSSSLTTTYRLFAQVISSHVDPESPRSASSLQKDLQEGEKRHLLNLRKIHSSGDRLQHIAAELGTLQDNYKDTKEQLHHSTLSLKKLTEVINDLLSEVGLEHILSAVLSPRFNLSRQLEELVSCLILYSQNIKQKLSLFHLHTNQKDQHFSLQLKESSDQLSQYQQKIEELEHYIDDYQKNSIKDKELIITKLNSANEHISKLLRHNRHDKDKFEFEKKEYENQIRESQQIRKKLDEDLVKLQINLEPKIKYYEAKEKQLEIEINELKDTIKSKNQHYSVNLEEKDDLISNLKLTLSQLQRELDQMKDKFKDQNNQKEQLNKKIDQLKLELDKEREEKIKEMNSNDETRIELQTLREQQDEDIKILQNKLDDKASKICDLEHYLRSKEQKISQLEFNLQIEKQNSLTIMSDTKVLESQLKKMQSIMFECTKSKYKIPTNSNPANSESNNEEEHTLRESLIQSQERELKLQELLNQKDEEIIQLKDSLNDKIIHKNQELESVTLKLEALEYEMESVLEGLEISASLGEMNHQVSNALQQRTKHLEKLNKTSQSLSEGLNNLSTENLTLRKQISNNYDTEEQLKCAQRSARDAREECRQERINSAKLEQQCRLLQVELEAIKTKMNESTQNQQIRNVFDNIKHNEFGTFLERFSESAINGSDSGNQSVEFPSSLK